MDRASEFDEEQKAESFSLEDLDPRSRSIVEKRASGMKIEPLAALHKIDERTVRRTLDQPEVKKLVIQLANEMYESMESQDISLYDPAMEVLLRIMENGSDATAARIAQWFVDRASTATTQRRSAIQIEEKVATIERILEELR